MDDSRANIEGGTTVVEHSGTALGGSKTVGLEPCTIDPCEKMAGGKMVVEESEAILVGGSGGGGGASVAGGKTVVKGCCNIAGGKTVVAASCGAVMGEGIH